LAVAWLALVAADLGYYSIARFAGPRLLRIRPLRAILGANRIEESEKYFARRGPRIIFLCRFVVGLRAAAIMASGFLRYPLGRFLARDLPALVIGVTAWLGVGYSIGIQVEGGIGAIGNALSIGGPAAAIVAAILVYRSVRRDRLRLAADAVG
jgi:membrane protein DedA with SNARE-associated domain